jgi:hypothetical protein
VQVVGNISEETDENLNSTIESFSENAWDNYQDPYPTVSEDGNEEKLDDSHLQWEASTLSSTFEFDDDFQLLARKKKTSVRFIVVVVQANTKYCEHWKSHLGCQQSVPTCKTMRPNQSRKAVNTIAFWSPTHAHVFLCMHYTKSLHFFIVLCVLIS